MGLLSGIRNIKAMDAAATEAGRTQQAQWRESRDAELAAQDVHVVRYFNVAQFTKDAEHMGTLGFDVASQSQVGRTGYGILVTYRKHT